MDFCELDQSPIEDAPEESEEPSQQYSQEEEQDDLDPDDCQTFKGSFLMEMQKLTRPLQFQKQRHNIYQQLYEDNDNILSSIKDQSDQPFTFTVDDQADLSQLVVDFSSKMVEVECCCRCHEEELKYSSDKNVKSRGSQGESIQKLVVERKEEKKARGTDKKWTSISLKDYKMQIKKKLQEKKEMM